MNIIFSFFYFLKMYASNIPTILVCFIAFMIVLNNKSRLREAALPALLGFGLALILDIITPIFYEIIIPKLTQDYPDKLPSIMMGIGMLGSTLWSGVLLLLLLSIIKGRTDWRSQ